jgi:hypothetical protein
MSGKREKAKRKAAPVPEVQTPATVLGPDGKPARGIEATEAEETTPADIHFFRSIVRRHMPHLDTRQAEEQARAMLARHPLIEKAYRDGLRQGRDLRERTQRGLGWLPWPSLEELLPRERGFVMSKIREAIGVEN